MLNDPILLGYDVETTGLDFKTDRIIEVGLVLWSVKKAKMLDMASMFVFHPGMPPLSQEIKDITGIDDDDISKQGFGWSFVQEKMVDFASRADFWVAHNARFDKGMTIGQGLTRDLHDLVTKKVWIDTKVDLPYKGKMGSGSLTAIAANHGFLNPFAHRAVFDVLTMMRVLSYYEWDAILDRVVSPTIEVVVCGDTFDQKDEIKQQGFYWKPERKVWARPLKECDLDTYRKKWNFPVIVQPLSEHPNE